MLGTWSGFVAKPLLVLTALFAASLAEARSQSPSELATRTADTRGVDACAFGSTRFRLCAVPAARSHARARVKIARCARYGGRHSSRPADSGDSPANEPPRHHSIPGLLPLHAMADSAAFSARRAGPRKIAVVHFGAGPAVVLRDPTAVSRVQVPADRCTDVVSSEPPAPRGPPARS